MGLGEHDLDLGLIGGRERDPAESVVLDLVAHLEAEGVSVDGEGRIRVVDENVYVAE